MHKKWKKVLALVLSLTILLSMNNIYQLWGKSARESVSGETLKSEENEGSVLLGEEETSESNENEQETEVSENSTEDSSEENAGDSSEESTEESSEENSEENSEESTEESSEESTEKSTEESTEENSETIEYEETIGSNNNEETTKNNNKKEEKETEKQVIEGNKPLELPNELPENMEPLKNIPSMYATAAGTTVSATNALNYDDYSNINIGVYNHDDWKALVAITHKTDLKGVTIYLYNDSSKESDKQTWYLTDADLCYTDADGKKTYGLGCVEFPFAGNIEPKFSLEIRPTSYSLFNYISTEATFGSTKYATTINYTGYKSGVSGGIANFLVMNQNEWICNYTNTSIKGYVGNSNVEAAGGLFGTVERGAVQGNVKFVIDKNMASVANIQNVYGKISGGIIGRVGDGISVVLRADAASTTGSTLVNLPGLVQSASTCAGGIVGKLFDGAAIVTEGSGESNIIILRAGISGSIYSRIRGTGATGGLAGIVENAAVDVSYIRKEDTVRGTQYVGGLVGLACSTAADKAVVIKVNHFTLAGYRVTQDTTPGTEAYCVGGVIGKYETTVNDTLSMLSVSNIKSDHATREWSDSARNYPRIESAGVDSKYDYLYNGGVVGAVKGNNVTIKDIIISPTEYRMCQIWNSYSDGNTSSSHKNNRITCGSIAGDICGTNITIQNIVVDSQKMAAIGDGTCDMGLTGYYVGGLVGLVNYYNKADFGVTKMAIRDIEIRSIHTWNSETYFGGLFARVGLGSVISIGGNIDLSGLTKNPKSSATLTTNWTKYSELPGSTRQKGFIAGVAYESLIYFDTDAVVTRPTFELNGITYFGDPNGGANTMNTDNVSYAGYCIDDIGNYGSVFRNVLENGIKVINYEAAYGSEVTGTVTTTTIGDKEYYVLDSTADFLRLAIAGNTYVSGGSVHNPRFGGSCFGTDVTISTLMTKNFLVQTDVDLGGLGIYALLRNDSQTYGFSGTFKGDTKSDSTKYVINMDFMSRQYYGGLFPRINSGADFENLIFDGIVGYQVPINNGEGGVGVIAAQGNGRLTFKGVEVRAKVKGCYNSNTWHDASMYAQGGFVGYIYLGANTLTIEDCVVATKISMIHNHNFAGGFAGKVVTAKNSNIAVSGCTISSSVIVNGYYVSTNTNRQHARESTFIAFIGDAPSSVSGTSGNNASPGTVRSSIYTTMTVTDCTIDGAVIDLSSDNQNFLTACGGFLGYGWVNVDLSISDITIQGDSVIKSVGYVGGLVSYISGKVNAHDITISKLTMTNFNSTWGYYSSFLFGNAVNAYIIFDADSYSISSTNVTANSYKNFDEIVGINMPVEDYNNVNSRMNGTYSGGGVLNIIGTNFGKFDGTGYAEGKRYTSYVNQVLTNVNPYTRYYYNLFGENAKGTAEEVQTEKNKWNVTVSSYASVSTPEQFMTTHIGIFSASNIKPYFYQYFSNNTINYSEIRLEQDIDMNGYSLYPTYLDSKRFIGNGNQVKLYGEEISNLESGLNTTYSEKVNRNNELLTTNSQHYLMHAALFCQIKNSTIDNVELTGSAAYNGSKSGALVVGGITGANTISNITLNNINISNYTDEKCGLMLGHVGIDNYGVDAAANLSISNIRTTGYDGTKPAAGALIGNVGSSSATDVQITFSNLLLHSHLTDNVFEHASLVCNYQYTSNIESNRCYLLYTFNYLDTVSVTHDEETDKDVYANDNHNVTYGRELVKGADYNDRTIDSIPAGNPNPLKDAIDTLKVNGTYYIPYVYTIRDIFVNPQNGNIVVGCGTYEDPYIITSSRQLLSLYCYLSGKTMYYNMLKPKNGAGATETGATTGWKVNKVGGDGDATICNVKDAETRGETVSHTEVEFTYENGVIGADFPTKDQLRTAYYKIENDIDMNEVRDLNDGILVDEYSGLGTQSFPFAGVIVGKLLDNGKYPVITLPKQGEGNNVQANYGFIQFMDGAVVKDLNVVTPEKAVGDTDEVFINVSSAGGGIASVIVGGDNIIDNVTCGVRLSSHNTQDYTKSATTIGGYVGSLINGTLIIRNINGKNAVAGCEFKHYKYVNETTGTNTYYKYADKADAANDTVSDNESAYVGLLVGKVYDGSVIYEHSDTENAFEDVSKKILTKETLVVSHNTSNKLRIANGFEVINGYAIDQAVSNDGRIGVSTDENGNLIVDIKNGEELEVISLALNNDTLTVSYNGSNCLENNRVSNHADYGYDYATRSRKALYNEIGAFGTDRDNAVKYDDGNMDIHILPYLLYRYADFTVSDAENDTTLAMSITGEQNLANFTNYKLKTLVDNTVKNNNVDYDIYTSKFNRINDEVTDYVTTYFLNKNATATFDVSDYGMSFRGMGALYTKNKSDFRANFNGNGKNVQITMIRDFDKAFDFPTGMFNSLTYDSRYKGTLTNRTTTNGRTNELPLTISNINIVDSIFENTATNGTFTGALAGVVEGVWNFNNIVLKNTSSSESAVQSRVVGKSFVGGIIGSINPTLWYSGYNDTYHLSSNHINISGCGIEGQSGNNVLVNSGTYAATSVGGVAGGIGRYLPVSSNRYLYMGEVNMTDLSVKYADIESGSVGDVGGFAGTLGFRRKDIQYAMVGRATVTNSESFITASKKNIDNVTLSNSVVVNTNESASIGGAFGQVGLTNYCTFNPDYGTLDINGFKADHLTISPSKTKTGLTSEDKNGIGGVIGYIRAGVLNINNAEISNSTIGNLTNNNLSAGGVVGINYRDSQGTSGYQLMGKTNISNITVDKTNVYSNKRYAAGVVGELTEYHNTFENISVKNGSHIESNEYSVGGVVAYLRPYFAGYDTKFKDINVENTEILTLEESSSGSCTSSAGGIIGYTTYTYDKSSYNLCIENAYVGKGCWLRAVRAAGGIVGSVSVTDNKIDDYINMSITGKIGIGEKYNAGTDTWTGDSGYNNFSGRNVGAFIGEDNYTAVLNVPADIHIANNRIYSYDKRGNTNQRCRAGGMYGYKNAGSKEMIYDKLVIKNNIIINSGKGKSADKEYASGATYPVAGGVFGGYEGNSGYGTHFPDLTLQNNSIGFYDVSGDSTTSKYLSYKNLLLSSDQVKLIYYDEKNKANGINWKEKVINEDNVGRFSLGYGTIIGYSGTNRQVMILRPTITYNDTVGSIPVVDVGNVSFSTSASQYGTSYPYAYRSNVHVIRLNEVTAGVGSNLDSTITGDTNSKGETEYFFGDMERIVSKYQTVKNSPVTDVSSAAEIKTANLAFIQSDRLNIYLTNNGVNYNLYGGDNNYYSETYKNDNGYVGKFNNVPVVVLDGHKVQHLADYPAMLLTDGAGATQSTMSSMNSSGMFKVTTINAVILPDGTIIKNNGSYGNGDNKSYASVKAKNNYSVTLDGCPYDEFGQTDNGGGGMYYTITMVQYVYSVKKTDGTYDYETVYIPIYVKEKVTIRSSVRILGDENYSYNDAKLIGKSGSLVIAHGSIYTIFAEFNYDEIRVKEAFKELKVVKTLVFEQSREGIPVGTRLTLVDAQSGQEYYYTVENQRVNSIPFTEFKCNNVPYSERNIGTRNSGDGGVDDNTKDITMIETNYKMFDGTIVKNQSAIERYYIFVQPPTGNYNISFACRITAEPKDEHDVAMDGYFKKFLDKDIKMEFIPGPQISFAGVTRNETGAYVGTKELTIAEGKISNDETIEIDTSIDITLLDESSYWKNKASTIDSTNNNKSIDIAIKLTDEYDNEVPWPEGTNVVFNGSIPKTVSGPTIYVYKDMGRQFMFDSLDRDMNGENKWYRYTFFDEDLQEDRTVWLELNPDGNYYYYENQTEKVRVDNVDISSLTALSNYNHISLDFSLADVDDYAKNKYKIVMKLYRSTNPDFPLEEEVEEYIDDTSEEKNRYTSYDNEVYGESTKDIGVALEVKDMMELGINMYNNNSTEEKIDFISKMDFTNVINSKRPEKAEMDIKTCAEAGYMVVYRLQKKNMAGQYVTIPWNTSPFSLSTLEISEAQEVTTELENAQIDGDNVYVETKKFTEGQLKTGENGIKYVTSWDLRLKADMEKLRASNDLLTNYRIQVTYQSYDDGEDALGEAGKIDRPDSDIAAYLSDFFIFTVAKLKTDL